MNQRNILNFAIFQVLFSSVVWAQPSIDWYQAFQPDDGDPDFSSGHLLTVDPLDSSIYVCLTPRINASAHRIEILKYDPDGNLLWQTEYPSDAVAYANLMQMANGNLVIAGSVGASATVFELDGTDGSLLWTRQR